jgi:hypothetical protein
MYSDSHIIHSHSCNVAFQQAFSNRAILRTYLARVWYSIVLLWSDLETYTNSFHGPFECHESKDLQWLSAQIRTLLDIAFWRCCERQSVSYIQNSLVSFVAVDRLVKGFPNFPQAPNNVWQFKQNLLPTYNL